MPQNAKPDNSATLAQELDEALATLDDALLQAGRSVAVIRRAVPQFATLNRVVHEMEAAMTHARQQLDGSSTVVPPPGLRTVPEQDAASTEARTVGDISAPSEPAPDEPTYEEDSQQPASASSGVSATRCLRLEVATKTGSLDLKAVDGSVNENPAVQDVALLDYDGRRATLKLWVNDSSDPEGVRDAVISSLRNHLGDESQATVSLTFESGSAA